MIDKRLLGTWRSDPRRTLNGWVWPRGTTAKQRKLITGLIGHLTIRYTRLRIRSEYKGHKDSQPYEVIGIDTDSVALMVPVDGMEERRIYHVHFEGDNHYWITIGLQREWFRRVVDRAAE